MMDCYAACDVTEKAKVLYVPAVVCFCCHCLPVQVICAWLGLFVPLLRVSLKMIMLSGAYVTEVLFGGTFSLSVCLAV